MCAKASFSKESKVEPDKKEKQEVLSQTSLMWRKFRRNKTAVIGLVVVIIIYLLVAFANFVAPYPFNKRHTNYTNQPPQKLHIWDGNGFFRPYIYNYERKLDQETYETTFVENKDKKHYIHFLSRGEEYKFLGLFETDLHLFGIEDEEAKVFLLGTDRFGRDMLGRILSGGRISLSISLLGVIIMVVLGSFLGTVSGYYGGFIDNLLQRLIEFLLSFPRIPLWMALSAALPSDWSSVRVYIGIVIILSIIGWPRMARQIRGIVMGMSEEEFISAAKASGASDLYIIIRHLIPNSLSHIIVVATLQVPGMILGEASLSFLGLGIRPPMTSWGVLLQEVQNVRSLANTPWLFYPALFIIVTILAFNFLGDGLRDAADPFSN
ncbi:MAG: ABC transporter permease [bacterium]